MTLKTKANLVGTGAIISEVITFILCVLALVFRISFLSIFILLFNSTYYELKNTYLELRKQEIDEIIMKRKGIK